MFSAHVSYHLLTYVLDTLYVAYVFEMGEGLGPQIRRERRARALTQKELAEALGCTLRAVQWWESGKRSPRLPMLRKMHEHFVRTPKVQHMDGDGKRASQKAAA